MFNLIYMIIMQGSGSASQGEISFLSWNSKVQHILASTSYNGTTGEEGIQSNFYFLFNVVMFDGILNFSLYRLIFPVVWDLKKQKPVIR